jgi:hypothetical protein
MQEICVKIFFPISEWQESKIMLSKIFPLVILKGGYK